MRQRGRDNGHQGRARRSSKPLRERERENGRQGKTKGPERDP